MKRWAVAYTHPKQEDRAVLNLERQGYGAWVPKITRTRRIRNQFVNRQEVVFPCYLFVKLVPDQSWSPINHSFGVRYLITDKTSPLFIPNDFMLNLKDSLEGLASATETSSSWQPGMEIKIIQGPFAGQISHILSVESKERIKILFDILGHKVPLSLSSNAIIHSRAD